MKKDIWKIAVPLLLVVALLVVCIFLFRPGSGNEQSENTTGTPDNTQSTTQETTEPQVTEPEVTEPEVTEPEVTEPEVTEPEVTEPEVTEPEVTEPEVTEPEVTEPKVTEPEVTEPEVTEPEVTEPEVTEPEVTEPEVTEPEVTEPEVTEPEVTEPEVTEPEVTEPPVDDNIPALKNGVYQLSKPEHVYFMAEHPDKKYALCADIDMGGALWTPIDNFSGTLTGLIYWEYNYTISNLVIEAAQNDENVGFFRIISGTVQEINFENIRVSVSGTFTGNLGVVAGSASKALTDVDVKDSTLTATVKNANVGMLVGKTTQKVTECYVTGDMKIVLAGGNTYVSGGIGNAGAAVSTLESRVNITVTETAATSGATGGIAGKASGGVVRVNYGGHFNVAADATHVAGTLVGQLQNSLNNSYSCARSVKVTGAVSQHLHYGSSISGVSISACYTRDTANLEENTMSDAEYAMRKNVVDYMYEMCTIRWTPSVDLVFQCNHTTNNGHYQKYVAGTIYFGQPYTHGSASLERMKACMNPDGSIKTDIDTATWYDYFGNDCCDAVMWSWTLISEDANASYTGACLNTKGIIPVGGYTMSSKTETKAICKSNGAQKMYEAYAQTKMGDAVVWATGHVRLVAENAYVIRKADGSIDPDNSYLLIHEQGTGTSNLSSRHSTCQVNKKFTFRQLFNTYYIPITVEAYSNSKADEIEITTTNTRLTKDGVGKGIIKSNYRLKWVQISVKDASGKTVLLLRDIIPSSDSNLDGREVTRHASFSLLLGFEDEVSAMQLETGQRYSYEVRAYVSDQEIVVQSFEFTA